MGAKAGGDDDGPMADINVTPLVDVVLVILIVFMITVPSIVANRAMKVDLPETSGSSDFDEMATLPLDVFVRRESNGTVGLYVGDRAVDIEGMKVLVRDMGYDKNGLPVKIGGDKEIPYQEVIRVMDALSSMGITALQLDTKQVK